MENFNLIEFYVIFNSNMFKKDVFVKYSVQIVNVFVRQEGVI